MNTSVSVLTEPLLSEEGGLLTSVSVPVGVEGQTLGVAGVDILADSLQALANRDLSRTIDDKFSGSQEALREDFNLTVNSLNDMMASLCASIAEIRARSDEINLGSEKLAPGTER